jgi:hypothetical protein
VLTRMFGAGEPHLPVPTGGAIYGILEADFGKQPFHELGCIRRPCISTPLITYL